MRRVLGSIACVFALAGCNSTPSIVLSDSGPIGSDTPVVSMPDTPPATCPPSTLAPPEAPVCAASTLMCLMTAMDAAAQERCFMADPAGDACLACVNQDALSSCTMRGTCADENGRVDCCAEDTCPTGDMACLDMAFSMTGACADELTGLFDCANTDIMAGRCGITPSVCFMGAAGFFPDLRPETRIPFIVTQFWSGSFAD